MQHLKQRHPSDDNRTFPGLLSELQRFLPGGQQVADFVGRERPFVEASSVAGVSHVVDWFTRQVFQQTDSAILFLIGAPGNGKSYWSNRLVDHCATHGFRSVNDDGLHRRTYRYVHDELDRPLVVVNDATASDGRPSPTIRQLAECIESRGYLQVNINRGVFFRELAEVDVDVRRPSECAAVSVMRWLSFASGRGERQPEIPNDPRFSIVWAPSAPHETVIAGKLTIPNLGDVTIVAVRMDLHSILEPEPNCSTTKDRWEIPSLANRYKVTHPRSRNWASIDFWERTSGGGLLGQLTDHLREAQPTAWRSLNPIRANIDSLADPTYRAGLLSIMRLAELGSGRHFALRHLWAGAAIVVLGGAVQERDDDESAEILELLEKRVAEMSEEPIARLATMMQLANSRSHQAIFGAFADVDLITGGQIPVGRPRFDVSSDFVKVMMGADPCRDATPGFSGREKYASMAEAQHGSIREGWASPVVDAFRGVLESRFDLESQSIISSLRKIASELVQVNVLETDFDKELDRCIVEMLIADQTSEPWLDPPSRDAVLAWYADYLCRLYAVHLGIAAGTRDIAEYVSNWQEADENRLEQDTARNVLSMILPVFEGSQLQSMRLVGLFRPRTAAVTKPVTSPRMVALVPELKISSQTFGDSIIVTLSRDAGTNTESILSVSLDVPLLRESRLSANGEIGRSELTDDVTPMIERFRASAAEAGRWALLDSEKVVKIR